MRNGDEVLTAKLLATKAHADTEYKINKKIVSDNQTSHFSAFGAVTYSAMFPSTPTMINWHDWNEKKIRTMVMFDSQ